MRLPEDNSHTHQLRNDLLPVGKYDVLLQQPCTMSIPAYNLFKAIHKEKRKRRKEGEMDNGLRMDDGFSSSMDNCLVFLQRPDSPVKDRRRASLH
jgi:hypothetical protein